MTWALRRAWSRGDRVGYLKPIFRKRGKDVPALAASPGRKGARKPLHFSRLAPKKCRARVCGDGSAARYQRRGAPVDQGWSFSWRTRAARTEVEGCRKRLADYWVGLKGLQTMTRRNLFLSESDSQGSWNLPESSEAVIILARSL